MFITQSVVKFSVFIRIDFLSLGELVL